MLLVIIIVIVGLIAYFLFLKKVKCEICGKEVSVGNTHKVGDKACCDECLTKKKSIGLIRYKSETFGKEIKDISVIDEYERYFHDLCNDKSLLVGKGSKTDKYVLAEGVLLSPTVVLSYRYDDVIFRTSEIVAITMEEDVWQKELKDGIKGYIITIFTKNKFIPYIHTCIVGKDKFFKFSSTQEKERREALAEGLNTVFEAGSHKIEIPYNNFNGLKKYIKENEEELTKKGILDNEFTKDVFIENVKDASITNFKDLFAKSELNDTSMKAVEILLKFGYKDSITLQAL